MNDWGDWFGEDDSPADRKAIVYATADRLAANRVDVCDDCITEAYDQGAEGYDEQASLMVYIGAEMPDHNCIVYLEPELNARCDCGCNKRR